MAQEVLSKLDQSQLYKMVRQEGLKGDDEDSSKKLQESLREAVEEIGINHVTENMKKETLESLITPLKLAVVPEAPAKQVSKSVIRKRISGLIAEEGLSKFFSKMDEDLLTTFFEAAPTDEEKEDGKKKLASQVSRVVAEVGLQVFFGRFEVGFLQDLMESCKLKYNTNNQNALAAALALQKPAQKEKKKVAKAPKFSSKKLAIEKGITYQDIFQHYYAEDLHEYCKENDLKHSGTKKEIITRILAFLDGDETVKTGVKAASPKRKKSSPASKKSSTKKTTKKSSKKDSDDEKKTDEKEDKKADKKTKKSKKDAEEE